MELVRNVEFELGQQVYLHGKIEGTVVGYELGQSQTLYQTRWLSPSGDFIMVSVEAFELSTSKTSWGE